jgi:hypothetical protein
VGVGVGVVGVSEVRSVTLTLTHPPTLKYFSFDEVS